MAARTLAEQIELDAAPGGVFLPTSDAGAATGFNRLVTVYPECDPLRKFTLNCVFDEDGLPGSNQNWGEANQQDHAQGKRLREMAVLEGVPVSETRIRDRQPDDRPDVVKVGDNYWAVKRPVGRDNGMKAFECVRVGDILAKSLRNLGG